MPHLLRVVTNKMHQNGEFFSQFLSAARSARANDVISIVSGASTLLFINFRYPGPKIPKIT